MRNAHVAFVSVPIGSHLNQTLPLAETFARRGYRVSYAVADSFRERVEATGAEAIPLQLETLTAQTVDEFSFCRIATHTLPRIARFYETHRPSVMIYDFTSLAARILAHSTHIPAVRTSPHFAMSRQCFDTQLPDPTYRTQVLAGSTRADTFLRKYGIHDTGFIFHRESLNIHLFPREFEPCDTAVDDTCFHAGRCAGEQAGFGQWDVRNAQGKPVVLVAPSNSYLQGTDYFRVCIEALSDLQWHVVLSLGESTNPIPTGPLPHGFEIVRRVSHTRILPYASLVLCMGGMATASEAAYHGVPMIITSRGNAELEWLGDNFVRLGVGVHMRGADLKPETLRKSAMQAFDSTALRDNVTRLQHSVQRSPGAEETVNRIEDYMRKASSPA
jgi:macrolide glycosyltransferase